MEAIFVLLGLVVLALPVAVTVLIIGHVRLRRQVRTLNGIVADLQSAAFSTSPRNKPTGQAANALTAPLSSAPLSNTPPSNVHGPTPSAPATEAGDVPPKARATAMARPPRRTEPSTLQTLGVWLRDNWFYGVAAVSLALAGIFLVQYGIETGLLTPTMRVIAALAFGAALIAAGEAIRRRFGDDAASATAYLPSVLSGAGLVSQMGGVLAARLLYDLVAPGPALGALFAIALFGLLLGWRHGPLLAAVGLTGGMAAPFLVGGHSENPEWLLLYFGLLTALGLGIDTLRRWAWVSALAVALGFAAGLLLHLSAPGDEALMASFAGYGVGLMLLTLLIPSRALAPDHTGPGIVETVAATAETQRRPIFPVILSGALLVPCCAALCYAALFSALTWQLSVGLSAGLAVLLILWSRGAPALQDQAVLPALTLLALIAVPELNKEAQTALDARLTAQADLTEQRLPLDLSLLLMAATLVGLASAWRSLKPGRYSSVWPSVWAAAAALIAPLVGLALDFVWDARTLLGAWPWALHALALAALMVAQAARFARIDGAVRLRTALFTVSALACLAFALTVLLTDAALTLALAAVVVSAAALDRRFDLPQMTGFIAASIVALGYRLVIDPGLDWAIRAPVLEMLAAYGGTLAALLWSLWLCTLRPRPSARVFLESAAWSVAGMTISLVLYHVIEAHVGHDSQDLHWFLGLYGTIWIGTALAQLERLMLGGPMRWLRIALAVVFGLVALASLLTGGSLGNPLFEEQAVHGTIVLNTLIPAYLLPALTLMFGAWRLGQLPRWLRIGIALPGGALALLWAGLTIRHAWQGGLDMHIGNGISDGELYSYTVALLLAGAGLFYQALARRSDALRRAGVAVIALAVAKVFLIDISGLAGLMRVFSFLLLGLSLAGLAWFNRWVQTRATPVPSP
ncbi:DUF2339 domain-containing protein [Antarctobacter heliothermus]|uniref:Uncharacterized membrane protein n=1 Tax=Antarctobacter heliothermus TaxID=74033 RepID=A0A239J1Q1_9RHOB|nr:DUF2339 domain-containing protein [Antarctobacter heliothermus]SNS99851.1 Uncharacterized membrane protein [Antarctobacter heliothermus]